MAPCGRLPLPGDMAGRPRRLFTWPWALVHRSSARHMSLRPRLAAPPGVNSHTSVTAARAAFGRVRVRQSYHEELEDINNCLVEMSNAVGSAMSTATTSLLDADVALADLVIAGDDHIDATRESIEQRCFTLL